MIRVIFNKAVRCSITSAKVQKWLGRLGKEEPKFKGEVEISVVGDGLIKKINHQYRGKNKVTDVLSFAWHPVDAPMELWPASPELQRGERGKGRECLGEIYICYPQIKRQAKEYSVSVEQEFKRMLVHGLLHLAGYNHVKKQEANKMFKKQEKLINNI